MLTLLYASETWTTYQRHVKTLERFLQQCLRQILGIKWQSRTPDTDILAMSGSTTVAARLMKNQMRWAGHLVRMEDTRLPKQLFFGELRDGSRAQHKPKKRFRDSVNINLKRMQVPLKSFEAECADRGKWRKSVYLGAKRLEEGTVAQAKLRRACRKHEAVPATQWICDVCGRVLLSKAGLVNHLKSHQPRAATNIPLPAAPCACSIMYHMWQDMQVRGRAQAAHEDSWRGSSDSFRLRLAPVLPPMSQTMQVAGRTEEPPESAWTIGTN